MKNYCPNPQPIVWVDLNRQCPNCKGYVMKYRRKCPHCGLPVFSVMGKVYLR